MNYFWRYLLLTLLVSIIEIYPATIGSDSAVTRFNNIVTLSNNDRVAGFAALYGGFAFANASVTAIFDSFFPVSGTVSINGGKLALNRDLIFHDVLGFGFLGDIYGNNHTFQLPVLDTLPTTTSTTFLCTPYFISQVNIINDVETISWNYSEEYLVGLSDDGNVRIASFNGTALSLVASFATGPIPNADGDGQVAFRPDENKVAVARQVGGTGYQVAILDFDPATSSLTLTSSAVLPLLKDGVSCAWHPSGDYLAVGATLLNGPPPTAAQPSTIFIYPVNAAGTLGTPVSFNLGNQTLWYETIAWSKDGNYLAVGLFATGGLSELIVLRVTFSPLTIVGINASLGSGSSSPIIGRTVCGIDWGKGADYIAIGLEKPVPTPVGNDIRIYSHDGGTGGVGAGTITFRAGVSDIGATTEGISWEPSGSCMSASSDVTNPGGPPPFVAYFNTYSFNDLTNALTLISSFPQIVAAAEDDFEAARWGPIGRYAAVAGDNDTLSIYGLPGSICYTFSNLTIVQSSNLIVHDVCITFTGTNVWNGRGSTLELESTCIMRIAANSSLTFKDMNLIGLARSDIGPVASSSVLSLDNVNLVLSSDYTFTVGTLNIKNDVLVSGAGNSFIFSSTSTGHVTSGARFMFDKDTKFRYEPLNNTNTRTAFVLDDSTAQMIFNSSMLSTSSIGLQLTKGKLIFDGASSIINEGSLPGSSLEWGDGTAANILNVKFMPAAVVELTQGQLRYNNPS